MRTAPRHAVERRAVVDDRTVAQPGAEHVQAVERHVDVTRDAVVEDERGAREREAAARGDVIDEAVEPDAVHLHRVLALGRSSGQAALGGAEAASGPQQA